MTSFRGLDQTEGCNQHRRKAGFKHEENRRESQVVKRRCTKQDKEKNKFIKVLRELGGVILML